ncbi:unnamed protein product [Dicrocoelium dendriticum]|nr:unnamed protein product [Dicrocoelium dendriticum]
MHFILKTIIGREEEQAALVRLLGQNNPVAPCIVVNGPPGCGKSLLLSSTLADLELINGQRWVLVSCLEGFSSLTSTAPSPSSRFLFELVLRSIQSRYGSTSTVLSRCCDNPVKFLDALCELMRVITSERPNFSIASLVLVFDQAEKLRDADPFLLPLLVRLGPLVEEQLRREDSISCNVRLLTILVTHSLWEKFSSGTFHLEPVLLTLHNYSRDEMMRILLSIKPEAASEERYHRFLDLLLTICFPVCRSIFELIHLSKVNWPAFEEPIVKGMVSPDDEWGQWKLAQPTLKRSLSTLYLRSLAVPHWGLSVKFSGSELEPARVAPNLELPYYARFLLIAAFLASFNPRESDRKFFAKNIGKQTTRMKRKEKTAERFQKEL